MSEEKKQELRQKISESQKNVWSKLSHEERIQKMKPLFDGSDKFWSSVSEDERLKIYDKISLGLYHYYESNDPKDLKSMEERWKKIGEKTRINWNKLSTEEKLNKLNKLWEAVPDGPTEKLFMKHLKNHGFVINSNFVKCYRTDGYTDGNTFIHPNFYKLFGKINPITGAENFPFHRWDFRIYTKQSKDILIDIDGSVHNPKLNDYKPLGCNYTVKDIVEYYDAKRLYQIPPDCDAYVIECHEDILNDNNNVINLKTGETMKYRFFLSFLSLSQFSKDEIKDYFSNQK